MHFIFSVIAALFIAMLVFVVASFGFALLFGAVCIIVALASFSVLRNLLRRWLFLYHARMPAEKPVKKDIVHGRDHQGNVIIDAEFKEIPRKGRDR